MNFEKHVFICTQCAYIQENGEYSDPALTVQFRKEVKQAVKERYPDRKIRVNASGCLGQCEKGISCVIYPQNEWLTELRPGDKERIIEKL